MSKPFKFKTHTGKKFEVLFNLPKYKNKRCMGLCDDPKIRNPKIQIDRTIGAKSQLGTIIEEFIHAFYFEKLEKEVRPLATVLAKFLYLHGWRQAKPTKVEPPAKRKRTMKS
jgi:hypothetical protein